MDKRILERRIYISYKSRINAAERLKHAENFIKFLNIYYSICLTAFSIYSVVNSSVKLSLILTISSVALTLSIVFLSTKKYAERGQDMKKNYLALDQLYKNLSDALAEDNEEIKKTSDQYTELLNNSENHKTLDWLRARINIPEEKLTRKEKAHVYLDVSKNYFLKAMLIAMPLFMKYFANIIDWIIKV